MSTLGQRNFSHRQLVPGHAAHDSSWDVPASMSPRATDTQHVPHSLVVTRTFTSNIIVCHEEMVTLRLMDEILHRVQSTHQKAAPMIGCLEQPGVPPSPQNSMLRFCHRRTSTCARVWRVRGGVSGLDRSCSILNLEWVSGEDVSSSHFENSSNLCKILSINCLSAGGQRVLGKGQKVA